MRCNLITNPNSSGLARDIEVIQSLLHGHWIETHVIDSFSPVLDTAGRGADLNIFLESLNQGRYLRSHASANWFIPNSEYYYPEWDRFLPLISMVCCKTRDAQRLWSAKVGPARCLYTAFESRDLYQPGIERHPTAFLHVLGKSTDKGTREVLEAWRTIQHPLTIVTQAKTPAEEQVVRQLLSRYQFPSNVRHWHSISDELLTVEMNRNRFFILPSMNEGFGHALHEAFSCRAAVLTTDAAPMNEFPSVDKRLLIPVARTEPRMCVRWNYVTAEGIKAAVDRAVRLSVGELEEAGDRARAGWEQERREFRETFMAAIKSWWRWI